MKPVIRSSETDRVLSCNGSLTLTRLVDARDGGEGWEGTMVHWMIADRCIRELGAIPPEGGLPPPEVPPNYRLPNFSLWMVDWAIRHIRERVPDDWCLMVEVEMESEFDRWINRGHADIVAISPDGKRARGCDWKSGRDPVDPAENNEQVGSYCSLIRLTWLTVEEIEFDICQPRVSEEDGFERVSTVVVKDIDAVIASMDRRMCAALDNPMELETGRKQCTYCIGCSCPALQAEQKLMKLKMTPEVLATIKRAPDDASLGDFVVTARTLAKPIEDAERLLHERLDVVPEINAGSGTRITRRIQKGSWSWPDPLKTFQAIKELLPTEESLAKVLKPQTTNLKDEIAAVFHVKKTGKDAITAEAPTGQQGEKRLLVFL